MRIALQRFLIGMSLYSIFATILIFGLGYTALHPILQGGKEGVRRIIIGIYILWNIDHIRTYLKIYRKHIILISILIASSIGISWYTAHIIKRPQFYTQENLPKLIILGIKYCIQYALIFLGAAFVGHVRYIKNQKENLNKLIKFITQLIRWIIVGSLLWQGGKMMMPELFMWIGYGGLEKFIPNQAPPLYYLTGVDGFPRLSGIFSWPNEYGFFLVIFFGMIYKSLASLKSNRKRWGWTIYLLSIILTFSRGALIGVGVQAIIYFYKRYRRLVIRSVIIGCVGVILLSISKSASTDTHLQSKIRNAKLISDIPWWVGLGTSWPSIYYNGCNPVEKGSQYIDCYLPENYYMQLMIDMGVQGFLIRLAWVILLLIQGKYFTTQSQEPENQTLYFLGIGLVGLLAEGMFLHVFESSIVNYLFFVPFGIVFGYVCAKHSKHLPHRTG